METIHIVLPARAGAACDASRRDSRCRIPAAQLVMRPAAPRTVRIELTARRNHAPRSARPHPRGEMRWTLYTRLAGELADAGVQELALQCAGEPFLCDWLPDAIGHAKARGIPYTFVATDGCAAQPERVRACMDAGLDSLEFAVDFADAAQLRELTGARAALLRESLENLRGARQVRDARGFACALIASSLRRGDGQEERMAPLLAEVLPYVDEHYWRAPHRRGERRTIPCESLFADAHIAHDGTLCACEPEAGEAYAMADLSRVSFLEGWHGERFARLREAHLRRDVACTVCEDCGAPR